MSYRPEVDVSSVRYQTFGNVIRKVNVMLEREMDTITRERKSGRLVRWPSDQPIEIGGRSLSRSEVSRRTGISMAHVSKIFGGKRTPSLRTLQKIAGAFGASVNQVIDRLPASPTISP
jgi:transcriptional regulator with XRE-family HTH domain